MIVRRYNIPRHPDVDRQTIIADSRTLHIAAPQFPRVVTVAAERESSNPANAPRGMTPSADGRSVAGSLTPSVGLSGIRFAHITRPRTQPPLST